MAQSLAKILIHIVFSTKNRYPFITDKILLNELHAYLGGTLNKLDSPVIVVGGSFDHVHILCKLSRKYSIAKVVGDIKRNSSKWIKTKGRMLSKFEWQNGYGAFSIGKSETNRIKAYILNQEEHHKKKTFQDEFRLFLKSYGIDYNEMYVWD